MQSELSLTKVTLVQFCGNRRYWENRAQTEPVLFVDAGAVVGGALPNDFGDEVLTQFLSDLRRAEVLSGPAHRVLP